MIRDKGRFRLIAGDCRGMAVDGEHDDKRHSLIGDFGWLPDGYIAKHRAPYDPYGKDARDGGGVHRARHRMDVMASVREFQRYARDRIWMRR